MVHGRCCIDVTTISFDHMSRIKFMNFTSEITLRQMLEYTSDEKSTSVQVMAWCHQAIWENIHTDLCHHMVSLGHNELKGYYTKVIQIWSGWKPYHLSIGSFFSPYRKKNTLWQQPKLQIIVQQCFLYNFVLVLFQFQCPMWYSSPLLLDITSKSSTTLDLYKNVDISSC